MEHSDLTIGKTTREISGNVIWELNRELLEDGTTYVFRPETTREEVLQYWFPIPGETYLATVGGKPVGCYLLRPNQPGRGSHVANASYFVSNRWRGHGVGRSMCEHSMDAARRAGYRAMQFNLVVSTNTGAIALWKALGFKTIGTIPKAFDHSELGHTDALIMHRLL